MTARAIVLAVAASACLFASATFAQTGEAAGTAVHPAAWSKAKHAKEAHEARAPVERSSGAASKTWSDLVKGTPEQQEMERRDNENARSTPIDHSKDEFGSDLKY